MKKRTNQRSGLSLAGKGIVTAAAAIMLTVQPGLSFPAWADEYNEYFDSEKRLIRTAGSYDDGTTSSSKYQYDKQGNVIYYSSIGRDGSKKEEHYTYKNGVLTAENKYEYDAYYDWEEITVKQYENSRFPVYEYNKVTRKDEIITNREEWNLYWDIPIRTVEIDREGISTQTDYTYNDLGQKSIVHTSSSDGSYSQTDFQYDGSGQISHYKTSAYDAPSQTHQWIEEWKTPEDNQTTKRVTSHRDGLQDVEEYIYNSDGNEILYTKTSSNGLTAKKVTNYDQTGNVSTYTDSEGNEIYTSEVYDSERGLTTDEKRHTYSDGSVSYVKFVFSDDGSYFSGLDRMVAADGTETYTESIEDSEGNRTSTYKSEDGTITIRRYDQDDNLISIEETLADGTTATVHTTEREDGKPLTMTKQYSDGSEYRIEFQYNTSGERIKETEIGRNGVVVVADYQYWNAGGDITQLTVSFNNGYQLIEHYAKMDDGSRQWILTYNAGEVFQDMIFYREEEEFEAKRIYSDGRVEALHVDNTAEDYTEQYETWRKAITDYRKAFLETANVTSPVQVE